MIIFQEHIYYNEQIVNKYFFTCHDFVLSLTSSCNDILVSFFFFTKSPSFHVDSLLNVCTLYVDSLLYLHYTYFP